jgi:ribosome-associated protein
LTTIAPKAASANKVQRLNKNSKLFKTVIRAIQDKKGENIISLDLRKVPEAVADFFIVCQAPSSTQIRAIAHNLEDEVSLHCGEKPFHTEGHAAYQWLIIDYINIVVHIMHPETRKHYRLEDMWSDADATHHDL